MKLFSNKSLSDPDLMPVAANRTWHNFIKTSNTLILRPGQGRQYLFIVHWLDLDRVPWPDIL